MSVVGQAKAVLTADTADYVKDMRAASDEARNFKKSSDQAKQGAAGFGDVLKAGVKGAADFAKGIGLAAGTFAVTWKKAMDLGKEGAMLGLMENRFHRLSTAIGTTSERLKTDLKEATRGMVSDSELMQSASDLMSLGLANTHDEVVRLTRVAGGLNMNMNQLVLTLTNQTTARFDTLGVSIDGFDEKVDKLVDSGMDVNAAFTEAFLQQAEQQLDLLGDVAETDVGKFARLETATKNLGDAFKKELTPYLATAAEAATILLTWNDQVTAAFEENRDLVLQNAESYGEYARKVVDLGTTAGIVNESAANSIYRLVTSHETLDNVQLRNKQGILEMIDALGLLDQATFANEKSSMDLRSAWELMHADQFAGDLGTMAGEAETAASKLGEVAASLNEITSASLARDAMEKLNQVWATGKMPQEEYERLFTEIATGMAGLPNQQVMASLALFRLEQDYKDGKIELDGYISSLESLDGWLRGLPDHIVIDVDLRLPRIPSNYRINLPPGDYPAVPEQLGGDVLPFRPYWVGDSKLHGNEPELFVPQMAGRIIPGHQLTGGGGLQIIQHIYAGPGMDEIYLADVVISRLQQEMNVNVRTGIEYAGM